jgi:hypothetical protein
VKVPCREFWEKDTRVLKRHWDCPDMGRCKSFNVYKGLLELVSFLCIPSSLTRNCLCIWISAYFLVEKNIFFNVSHSLYIWVSLNMYLIHSKTRTWRGIFHRYLRKWCFPPSKLCYFIYVQEKQDCFINFKHYNLINSKERS